MLSGGAETPSTINSVSWGELKAGGARGQEMLIKKNNQTGRGSATNVPLHHGRKSDGVRLRIPDMLSWQ